MLVLLGSSPLQPAQRSSLQARLARISQVCSVDSLYIHYVSVFPGQDLSNPEDPRRKILHLLLEYGDQYASAETIEAASLAIEGTGKAVFVVPRAGSISPWSSKATNISDMFLFDCVERVERGTVFILKDKDGQILTVEDLKPEALALLFDRMTQSIQSELTSEKLMFASCEPAPLRTIDLMGAASSREDAKAKLAQANTELGLALAKDELDYLLDAFLSPQINRNPTDVELFMFAQVNSEHCRHKIFNADWTIDGEKKNISLFGMIRNTHKLFPQFTLSAYSDNAAVMEGFTAPRFLATPLDDSLVYTQVNEDIPILLKVETHNHPTAVSPFPGAATGSGGEIRDEGAVGRGSRPKAGLAGFTVSNLLIPGFKQPWETDFGKPEHIASALDIMIDGPLGASAFNNEFGRPCLNGYFRTFAEAVPVTESSTEIRGYHKPIMIAGGYGQVRKPFALKSKINPGDLIIVLGGQGLLIGLGGGAASSMASGASSADLDFASVQRDNPEMQRRCQQVIDNCTALGEKNPITSIHDVGAGGLSNALPELVHDSDLGARFEIRDVHILDKGMSPMEIWCNESQERYVLAISPEDKGLFEAIVKRERCPYAIVGVATEEQRLVVTDRLLGSDAINLDMNVLFGKPPKMSRVITSSTPHRISFDTSLKSYLPSGTNALDESISRVLHLPTVASKSFLITIGDRSITGLVARDQFVGPWQVPVADVAVTKTTYGFDVKTGEAMAMGERTPLALLSASASAKMAVAESLLNITASSIESLERVKLSANWMCASSNSYDSAGLYEAVQAIGLDLCPALGVSIPVGKDSMSMSMKWKADGEDKVVTAPLSLIITAFAPVQDITQTWTPQIRTDIADPTVLIFVDLANGKQRLGGSALAQVYKQIGVDAPTVEDASTLKAFFEASQRIRSSHKDLVLAYHDRSDGGLFTTIVEMAFAGRIGVSIDVSAIVQDSDVISTLFNEELGAVFQIREKDIETFKAQFKNAGQVSVVAKVGKDEAITIKSNEQILYTSTRAELQKAWSETSFKMQSLRDSPDGALQEFEDISSDSTGLSYQPSFDPAENIALPVIERISSLEARPKVAILREQGVNGHVEMAWSFHQAGFAAIDVHMSDIISGRVSLSSFKGIAACGGFSYGDVLGAGSGWANSITLHPHTRSEFSAFFQRQDTFALAVCNGCQLFSQLRELIPGAENWPYFKPNKSGRFEGRTTLVKVDIPENKPSVFFRGMQGSILPIAVAHGEGRATWPGEANQDAVVLRYIDSTGAPTERYPYNPNGSPNGATGIQSSDGRVLALMPHLERVSQLDSNSWFPAEAQNWKGRGPWMRAFENARVWVG